MSICAILQDRDNLITENAKFYPDDSPKINARIDKLDQELVDLGYDWTRDYPEAVDDDGDFYGL